MDLASADIEGPSETTWKLLQAINEFHSYIERNQGFIPNYGERCRNGERIGAGFVESAVNQAMSKHKRNDTPAFGPAISNTRNTTSLDK